MGLLVDVLPLPTMDNGIDRHYMDTNQVCDAMLRQTPLPKEPNQVDIRLLEFGVSIRLATENLRGISSEPVVLPVVWEPASVLHPPEVILLGSSRKVGGFAASRRVALVANEQTLGDASMGEDVSNPMGELNSASKVGLPVPMSKTSLPDSTSCLWVYLRSLEQFLKRLYGLLVVSSTLHNPSDVVYALTPFRGYMQPKVGY